jgi:hypothetical protein
MPPTRTPLRNLSANSRRGPDLSPFQRGQISGSSTEGAKTASISRKYTLPYSTVASTLNLEHLREDGASQHRSGRPLSYTLAEERRVLRHARANPKDTYRELIEGCSLLYSKNTVKKILKAYGIQNWIAKCRPYLTPAHAAKRLAWCLKYRHRNIEEWGIVMWSDKCSVEKGKGKRRE